jgi:ribonuclease HI
MNKSKVIIYTDGACKNNPGPGGWAAIITCQSKEKIITGSDKYTTNNRMELLSVINALNVLKFACEVELYTDSQYVKNGITKWLPNWRAKNWRTSSGSAVKNQDLWEALDAAVKNHNIAWHWVKAHNGNLINERVDCLARQAIICDK